MSWNWIKYLHQPLLPYTRSQSLYEQPATIAESYQNNFARTKLNSWIFYSSRP